jgi:hypothetical protein
MSLPLYNYVALSMGLITKPDYACTRKALHFGLGDNVLFSSWIISNAGGYFGTIVFTIFLAILRVVVSNYALKLQGNRKKKCYGDPVLFSSISLESLY